MNDRHKKETCHTGSMGSGHTGSHDHEHSEHIGFLKEELMCHFPYAAFSLAFGFILLSLIDFVTLGQSVAPAVLARAYHVLFHSFHYLHLIFAVTGTFVTFLRFSQRKNIGVGVVISLLAPAFFCTLSDIALPALAGNILGVSMKMHICFTNLYDSLNLLPFMLVGLANGYMIYRHSESSLGFISLASHFIHILISSLAALFYMVSYGFSGWSHMMGILFLFLIIAVVIPCTLSDIVVPMYFARVKKAKKA